MSPHGPHPQTVALSQPPWRTVSRDLSFLEKTGSPSDHRGNGMLSEALVHKSRYLAAALLWKSLAKKERKPEERQIRREEKYLAAPRLKLTKDGGSSTPAPHPTPKSICRCCSAQRKLPCPECPRETAELTTSLGPSAGWEHPSWVQVPFIVSLSCILNQRHHQLCSECQWARLAVLGELWRRGGERWGPPACQPPFGQPPRAPHYQTNKKLLKLLPAAFLRIQ